MKFWRVQQWLVVYIVPDSSWHWGSPPSRVHLFSSKPLIINQWIDGSSCTCYDVCICVYGTCLCCRLCHRAVTPALRFWSASAEKTKPVIQSWQCSSKLDARWLLCHVFCFMWRSHEKELEESYFAMWSCCATEFSRYRSFTLMRTQRCNLEVSLKREVWGDVGTGWDAYL